MSDFSKVKVYDGSETNAVQTQQHCGTLAIETSRAVTEAQGAIILAKKFPRDENAA